MTIWEARKDGILELLTRLPTQYRPQGQLRYEAEQEVARRLAAEHRAAA